MAKDTIRLHAFFSGTVQGVGFRYTTRHIAGGFKVTGFVRNLDDGRVELVAEGRREDVEAFLRAIEDEMKGYITRVEKHLCPATGEFSTFRIAF